MAPKPNAYSLFVNENHRRMQREGKNVPHSSLFKTLSSKWQSLSDAEKQVYKDRAKNPDWRHSNRDTPAPGSHSNPVSHVVLSDNNSERLAIMGPSSSNIGDTSRCTDLKPINNEIVEQKVSIKRAHDEIDWDDDDEAQNERNEKKLKVGIPNHWRARQDAPERYEDIHLVKIRENCKAIIESRANKLISMPLYSFSVNVLYFKRGDKEKGSTDIHVPIEIGICGYKIKSGRHGQPYHALIDAGPIPNGSKNDASDHAANHRITIPPFKSYPSGARKDYRKIYREIVKYVEEGERTILVWDAREMQQIIGSLEWLYEKANEQSGPGKIPKVSTWTILPVMEFIANVANFVNQNMLGLKEPVFIIHYYINMLLEISHRDYERHLMCEYHQDLDTKWCARSCAIRMFLNIETVLERIYQGYMYAVNPEFLKRKLQMQPIAYHQHRPSQQFLSDQAREAASSGRQSNQTQSIQQGDEQQQQPQPPLALTAPGQGNLRPENGNASTRMVIDDEPIPPVNVPVTTSLAQRSVVLRDPSVPA